MMPPISRVSSRSEQRLLSDQIQPGRFDRMSPFRVSLAVTFDSAASAFEERLCLRIRAQRSFGSC